MAKLEVAETILAQLGGKRFAMMTGAHGFAGDSKMLMFGIKAKAKDGIKAVRITLDASDTYTVEFFGRMFKAKAKVEGVYNDMLQEIFTKYTGLYTKF